MSSNPSASPSLAHRLSHSILTWVIGAILLALFLGSIRFGGHPFVPKPVGNVFATFSDLFSQFLSFSIPLIIIGLVTPAIADLGRGAGKWLGITTALAYASTLFAGFLTFVVCAATFPRLLAGTSLADVSKPEGALSSYFTVEMPPAVEVMTALLLSFVLGIQFLTAGLIGRRNPLKALLTMLPAYLTALGTSSSAATIPVTLRQTKKNGVSDAVASFTIPLCATIHLAGSTSKIFSFAFAIVLTQDLHVSTTQWIGFIFMLGITMVAAPGVPGGAIMAATGLLSSMLGFNDQQVALMIATYIALDSFGTATNVTGDGAIAIIVDRMAGGSVNDEGDPENVRELSFDGMAYLHAVSVEGVVSPEELEASAAATRSGE